MVGSRARFERTFHALRGRNYRLWYIGQGVSLIGNFLQQTALSWYLYRTTNSAFILGLASFASQIPTLLATPFAGVLADRIRRRDGLVATQILMMLQASIVAILVLTNHASTWAIIALSFFLGLVMAFDIPIRQSFMSEVVPDSRALPNAIALNSALFNAARLVGPALAGLAVAAVGEGLCLLGNAASFLAVLAAILAIRTTPPLRRREKTSIRGDFLEGARSAWTDPVIRPILALVAAVSTSGFAILALAPMIARDSLKGGPHTLGFLMGSVGAGSLVSALQLAGRTDILTLPRKAGRAAAVAGACIFVIGLHAPEFVVYACLFGAGYGFIQVSAGANSLLQSIVPEHFRGRIVSLFALAFMGTTPFGSLFLGWLAGKHGLDSATFLSGGVCLASGLAFLTKSQGIEAILRMQASPPSQP